MALSACSDDGNANGLGLRGEWKMHSALVHTELQMIVSCHALNPIECSEDLLLRSDQCEIVEDADSVTLDESSEGSFVQWLNTQCKGECTERIALSHAFTGLEL